jgi:transposase
VECDAGRRGNGPTTAERKELQQLRRENRQLRLERDILSKAVGSIPHPTLAND